MMPAMNQAPVFTPSGRSTTLTAVVQTKTPEMTPKPMVQPRSPARPASASKIHVTRNATRVNTITTGRGARAHRGAMP